MIEIYPHWDVMSLILYVALGIIGVICVKKVKNKEFVTGEKQSIFSAPYIIWWIIWVVIASFRHIELEIGGSDALNYMTFFRICLDSDMPSYFSHYDILYKLFNQVIRIFTDNYHIFFIILYGIIVYSYILFINEFETPKNKKIPLLLIVFPFILSFTTIRTSLTIALILIGIVLLNKNRKIWAFIFMFSTFFIQKASLLYAAFYVFYMIYKNRNIKLKHYFIYSGIAIVLAKIAQQVLMNFSSADLNGAYSYYASMSLNRSFFDNYWKIAFGQLILLVLIIIFKKSIIKEIEEETNENEKKKMHMIWTMCIFDLITIPISYILNIWRGCEYFYLARLLMYGQIMSIFLRKCTNDTKKIFTILIAGLFIFWLVFRIYNVWEDNLIMPYIFEPFYNWYE